jgi:hypothetical protein
MLRGFKMPKGIYDRSKAKSRKMDKKARKSSGTRKHASNTKPLARRPSLRANDSPIPTQTFARVARTRAEDDGPLPVANEDSELIEIVDNHLQQQQSEALRLAYDKIHKYEQDISRLHERYMILLERITAGLDPS